MIKSGGEAIIDTQALLWFFDRNPKLSAAADEALRRNDVVLRVSYATAWEIGIKHAKGNLKLPDAPEPFLARQIAVNHFRWLPISLGSIYHAAGLPRHHNDPFDRLLVAQAFRGSVPLISSDKQLDAYGVQRIW